MSDLHACIYVQYIHAQCQQRSGEGVECPAMGLQVVVSLHVSAGNWTGSSARTQGILTADPSLQSSYLQNCIKKIIPPKKGKVRVTADTCSIFVFILLMNGHFWFGKALSIVVQVSLLMVLCHALNSSLEGQKVLILLKPHLQLISLWLIDLCPNYIWFCPFQHHKHTPLFFFILHLGCRFPSLVSSQSLPDTPPQSCSLPLSSVSI